MKSNPGANHRSSARLLVGLTLSIGLRCWGQSPSIGPAVLGAEQLIAGSRLGPQSEQSGLIPASIDPSTRPQDDLWVYANGSWLTRVPIPDDRSRWGVDDVMDQETFLKLRNLLEGASGAADPDLRKAGALYASFMDADAVEKTGATALSQMLARITSISSIRELSAAMAELSQLGVRLPLVTTVGGDSKDPARYAVYFYQGGLGLPNRDYYLEDDPRFIAIRTAYRDYVAKALTLLGDRDSAVEAERIVDFETRLARLHWPAARAIDVVQTYNLRSPVQMDDASMGLFGRAFILGLGLPANAALVVEEPDVLEALGRLASDVELATWQAYLRWQLLTAYAPYLPEPYVQANFEFRGRKLAGLQALLPRWRRAVSLVDAQMGDALGKAYVARHFPPETKTKVVTLVNQIKAAFDRAIDESPWMSPGARPEAHAKLRRMAVKIGYPDRWKDYSALAIDPQDLAGNVMRARAFAWKLTAAKAGRPVDRGEFEFTPQTNNANYNRVLNAIEFPAAGLQPPLYNPKAPDAFNFGSLGATIGHEIMHGFDDQGSRYDADGRLRDWLSTEDRARFDARVERLVAQYDRYEPVKGYRINGRLTAGENLADLAGAEIAYRAFRMSAGDKPAPPVEGYTTDQLFYVAYAQSLLRKERTEVIIALLKSDPHSPSLYRVNGVVVNMPSFFDAFEMKPDDRMWVAPERRTQFWP